VRSPEVQPAVQQLGVAEGDETVVGDGQGRPQPCHLRLFVVEVGLRWRDGLELDEPSEPVDLVEVDADPFPDQQAVHLAHLADAEGLLERGPRARPVIDPGQSVLALRSTLLSGKQELNQMRTPRMLLAQLEASVAGAEVGGSLAQLAVVSCTELGGTR